MKKNGLCDHPKVDGEVRYIGKTWNVWEQPNGQFLLQNKMTGTLYPIDSDKALGWIDAQQKGTGPAPLW